MKIEGNLIRRQEYVDRILDAGRRKKIAIITGGRGSGKSCILRLVEEELRKACVPSARIIQMDFRKFTGVEHLLRALPSDAGFSGPKVYFLLDDVHKIECWPELLEMLYKKYNCIIYAVLGEPLNSDLRAKYWLDEHCVEIEVFPLSLTEFVAFHGYQIYRKSIDNTANPDGYSVNNGRKQKVSSKRPCDRYTIYDRNGLKIPEGVLLKQYFEYGGFPQIPSSSHDVLSLRTEHEGIFSSILFMDILDQKDRRQLSDPRLLKAVSQLLAVSIGENISDTQFTKRLNDYCGTTCAIQTVQAYIKALEDAKMFYPVKRYDIRKCKELSTLGKRYIVDTGLWNYICSNLLMQNTTLEMNNNVGYNEMLENSVYFELRRRGYEVYNGMLRNHNVTFVAIKGDVKKYFQVVGIADDEELETALKSLRAIRDNFEKFVILNKRGKEITNDGIHLVNSLDFLLGE